MDFFPIPAPAFEGRSHTVGLDAVFAWLRLGWNLFMSNPGVWVVSTVILIAGSCALMIVPLLGPLLAILLAPVLTAGLLAMCRKAAGGETITLSDLSIGFTTRTTPLILLGVIFMLAMLLIHVFVLVALLLSGSMAGGLLALGAIGIGILLGGGSLIALALSSLLFIPLWMAMWFAPALVFFNDMPPLKACKASFAACLKNIPSFLIFGLIVFVLSFFAVLPMMGLGFLVLVPVLAGTAYASYQDVFVAH
ncbi:MAG: hypothetical protein LBI62_06445 [Candidatus Accumulibacter sp.]|jgi:uncharacterized membrane protein|nr:hypothetical protein [Accumulibacter sp.]